MLILSGGCRGRLCESVLFCMFDIRMKRNGRQGVGRQNSAREGRLVASEGSGTKGFVCRLRHHNLWIYREEGEAKGSGKGHRKWG